MAKKIYTVQSGDYLRKIAIEQLGDESRWSEIAYINSLEQPYLIRPNDILLIPDDNDELRVVITEGQKPQAPVDHGAAVTKTAAFQFTPAMIVVVVAAVAFLLWDNK